MAKPTDQSDPAEPRRGFSRRDRLTHAREFQMVYAERAKKGAVGGAFALHARLNGLDRCRLGLAIGRRCGGAVVRNRIKRRVREAFRLARGAWSPPMDLVVVASPHEVFDIRATCGRSFIIVTPGIRPAEAGRNDQRRVMTPADAVRAGVDYIVVGRPIIEAADPVGAARAIVAEMAQGGR